MPECPQCSSKNYRKNGRVRGKQRYLCKECGRQFLEPQPEQKLSQNGMSLILLDLENLKLDPLAENFLKRIAIYPLQIKLAFANWSQKAVIKQDAELYERGYFLVHVPVGKNSADARMMTLGSAIRIHYPQVQEVFVCSSDWLLTNLCNELISQNLKVWRVRRQNKILEVENRNTGEIYTYSLDLNQEIPDAKVLLGKLEKLIAQEKQLMTDQIQELSQIEALLNTRREATAETLDLNRNEAEVPDLIQNNGNVLSSKIEIVSAEDLERAIALIIEDLQVNFPRKRVTPSTISNRFKDQFQLTANQLIKDLNLGKKITDFLEERPHLFTVHPKTKKVSTVLETQQATLTETITSSESIKKREEFKKILLELVESCLKKSGKKSIPVTTLGTAFKDFYGDSVSTVMKKIKVTGTFTKFLESCEEFKVKKSGKVYHVTTN